MKRSSNLILLMWWKRLMFGFTESLEPKPECDTSQHVYEEIGQKVTYCEKCELQNKCFGHEDVAGIEIRNLRIFETKVTKRCASWCSYLGEYECCCHLLKVPAVIWSVRYFETSVHNYQTTLIQVLEDNNFLTIGLFIL